MKPSRSSPLAPRAALGLSVAGHAAGLGLAAGLWWWTHASGGPDDTVHLVSTRPAAPPASWAVLEAEPTPEVQAPSPPPDPSPVETEAAPEFPVPGIPDPGHETLAVLPAGAPVPDASALLAPVPKAAPGSVEPPAEPAEAEPSAEPPAEPPSRARPPSLDPAGSPPPPYPSDADRRGLEGRVLLEVVVDAEGRAESVAVFVSSGHASLDEAARRAALAWRYRPAWDARGRPCAGTLYVPVRFSLEP